MKRNNRNRDVHSQHHPSLEFSMLLVCLPVPRRWVIAYIQSCCPSTNSHYASGRVVFLARRTTTEKEKECLCVHINMQNTPNTMHRTACNACSFLPQTCT